MARLGRFAHERRWVVLGIWLVAFLGIGAGSAALGPGFVTEFTPPDVESRRGFELIDEHFGDIGASLGGKIVFQTAAGVEDPSVRGPMEEFFEAADAIEEIRIVSPWSTEPGPRRISEDGTIAYAEVEFLDDVNQSEAIVIRDEILELLPDLDGVRVELAGQIFADFEPPASELIGLAFAVIVLIVAVGSVLAMGLSIGTALVGIGIGMSLVTVLAHVVEMPDFTSFVAIMIGLGVGIDYALFIINRYREEVHGGRSEVEATAVAIDTAGRSVLFAGMTVVISLLGMLIMGISFVNGMALGSAVVVAVTMLASVTLLPALLGFAGANMEVTKWRGVIASGLVSIGLLGLGLSVTPMLVAFPAAAVVLVAGFFVSPLRARIPHRPPKPTEETFAYRWSRIIQANPWPAVVLSVTGLLVLSIPVLSLRMGFSDEGNFPEETTTRQAYDLLAEGFGPGFNGPLIVVMEVAEGTDPELLMTLATRLSETEGVAFASPPVPNDLTDPTAEPAAVLYQVVPDSAPQDAATTDLVNRLRDEVIPEVVEGTELDPAVTGYVAVATDFSQYIAARMPIFLGAVLALSFLLLMVVFRSLLVPLKAVLMNLLSIGAAYGMSVAVFQWGWGREALAVQSAGPIEPFIPMMMFAIVFGLSMDYEVFLLSRIKEEYDHGAANDKAVADGLAATARVITAAAAIMVVVFGSFLLEADRVVKLMGFGLAIAVLLDATVVRMVLVPATMELLGDRNWWLPKWLDRILPSIDVEGSHLPDLELLEAADADPGRSGGPGEPGSPAREPVTTR